MGMTTTKTTAQPANITQISIWSGPAGTGAHRTDIEPRTPVTRDEAIEIAETMVDRQGYDPNGVVFITTRRR